MARGVVARRYAQAVFQLALETQELERWHEDLRRIAEVLGQPEMAAFLKSAQVPLSEKLRVTETTIQGITPLARNLVRLLLAKERAESAPTILAEYEKLLDWQRGIVRAQVITAVPLRGEEEARLAERLSSWTGKRVLLESRVEPEILGGLIARIGDKVLDGSTRGKLLALKGQLREGRGG